MEGIYDVIFMSIASSVGGILLSAVFGNKSVVMPLIFTLLNGFIINFVLEVVFIDVMAGSSIYDVSLVPSIVSKILSFAEYTFVGFFVLDYRNIQNN